MSSSDTYGARAFRGKAPKLPSALQLAREGAHGRGWYASARASIMRYAFHNGHCPRTVADVLAITSPRVHVSRNVSMAHEHLSTGRHPRGAMRQIRDALDRYASTRAYGGLKVNAFADALLGDPDAVVVDVWMVRAYGKGEEWPSITPKRYAAISGWIRASATRLGWTPAETQAAIWTGCRARYGYVNAGDLAMPTKEV